MSFSLDLSTLLPLASVLVSAAAPIITSAVKKAAGVVKAQIPNAIKPVINAAAAAVLAGLVSGGDPVVTLGGVAVGEVFRGVRDTLDS